jgi:hypothetical protein
MNNYQLKGNFIKKQLYRQQNMTTCQLGGKFIIKNITATLKHDKLLIEAIY